MLKHSPMYFQFVFHTVSGIHRLSKILIRSVISVVRNISMHEGPSKQLFLEHVDKFAERLVAETEPLTSPLCPQVALECARILANLDQIEFLQVCILIKHKRYKSFANSTALRCLNPLIFSYPFLEHWLHSEFRIRHSTWINSPRTKMNFIYYLHKK